MITDSHPHDTDRLAEIRERLRETEGNALPAIADYWRGLCNELMQYIDEFNDALERWGAGARISPSPTQEEEDE